MTEELHPLLKDTWRYGPQAWMIFDEERIKEIDRRLKELDEAKKEPWLFYVKETMRIRNERRITPTTKRP